MGMSNLVLDAEEKKFTEWMAKVDTICQDKLATPVDCLTDYAWAEACADGLTPLEAFNDYYEWMFDEPWSETNGQFGVGA